jgi:transposase
MDELEKYRETVLLGSYSTEEAAKLINRSSQTVRNYIDEFSEYFSSTAAPSEDGNHRKLTEDDFDAIFLISTLRSRKYRYEEIVEALDKRQGTFSSELVKTSYLPTKSDLQTKDNDTLPADLYAELEHLRSFIEENEILVKKAQAVLAEKQYTDELVSVRTQQNQDEKRRLVEAFVKVIQSKNSKISEMAEENQKLTIRLIELELELDKTKSKITVLEAQLRADQPNNRS